MDAVGEYAVFNLALNNAPVGNKRIFNALAETVNRGNLVPDFCINSRAASEKLISVLFLKQ